MQDLPVGLREAKKSETRRRLSLAARSLALTRGLDGVTVEQVCAEVGVSPRTFFNYFESKEQAVLGEEPGLAPSARRAFLDGGPTGELLTDLLLLLDPSQALEQEGRENLRANLRLVQQEPRLLALHVARQMAGEREVAALVAERQGLPGPDTGCTALVAVASALLRTACADWFAADDGSPLRAHVDRTREALVSVLGPARALLAS